MSESVSAATPMTPLDHVRLTVDGTSVMAHCPDRYGVEPFQLPPLPKSMSDWAALLCSQFLLQHQCCLAILLMLDVHTRNWGVAIPRQRASRDSSCWRPAAEDFPAAAGRSLVAGSFQTRLFAPGEAPIDAIPPVDGVHVILHAKRDVPTILCFVRAKSHTAPVAAPEVIFDDCRLMIDNAMPRIDLV